MVDVPSKEKKKVTSIEHALCGIYREDPGEKIESKEAEEKNS